MSISLLVHVSDSQSRSSRSHAPATIAIRTDGGRTSAEVVELPNGAERAGVLPNPAQRVKDKIASLPQVPLPREVHEALEEARSRRPRITHPNGRDEPLFVDAIDVTGETIEETVHVASSLIRPAPSRQRSSPAYGFDVYTKTTLPPPPRKGDVVTAVV